MTTLETTAAVHSQVLYGDRGSTAIALESKDPAALRETFERLAGGWRKVCLDVAGGIAELMAPSYDHARAKVGAENLVLALCHVLGINVVQLSDTTIEAPGGGRGEPDSSFLVGPRATAFLRTAAREGMRAADARFLSSGNTAPDLAIEVEHFNRRPDKPGIYGKAGVKELWEVATLSAGRQPAIHELQDTGGPRTIDASALIPGVRAERLPEAIDMLWDFGGYGGFVSRVSAGDAEAARGLLATAGIEDMPLTERGPADDKDAPGP